MSRGPGKVERAVSAALTDDWQTMRDLASKIGNADPSRAAVESVRRACRRLVDRGSGELDYLDTGYPTSYDSGSGRLWSAIGDGRNAYEPEHRPVAPCWELAARRKC